MILAWPGFARRPRDSRRRRGGYRMRGRASPPPDAAAGLGEGSLSHSVHCPRHHETQPPSTAQRMREDRKPPSRRPPFCSRACSSVAANHSRCRAVPPGSKWAVQGTSHNADSWLVSASAPCPLPTVPPSTHALEGAGCSAAVVPNCAAWPRTPAALCESSNAITAWLPSCGFPCIRGINAVVSPECFLSCFYF